MSKIAVARVRVVRDDDDDVLSSPPVDVFADCFLDR